jgi:hypothetical protein
MNNKIETLRAVCFTKDDMKNITNLSDTFTDKEIEFMVEFKKIYELGLDQLKKFIDKLDSEGKDLDTYSIQYYIDILNNGPLGTYVRKFSKDKKYFVNTPDTLGMLGNKAYSPTNNALYQDSPKQLGCAVDTFNKLPQFFQKTMETAIKQTEEVFRSSLKSSMQIDNTLPTIDKNQKLRYAEETKGDWVKRSNGCYLVKDSYYYIAIDQVSAKIFDKVKEELGDENFRMYSDKKKYDPFSDKNESTATNQKIEKNVVVGDKTQKVTLDLMGDVFDSEDKRDASIKIQNDSKDKEYKLNTVEGQLGN